MAKRLASVATITVPLGDFVPEGYERETVAGGRLTAHDPGLHLNLVVGKELAEQFLRMRTGLRAEHAKLPDGRPVFSNADVVRWLLSQVA